MLYVVIAIILVAAVISVYRLRQGGPGPATNGVPRRFQGRLNSMYQRVGWQRPYDENGTRNRDRSAL